MTSEKPRVAVLGGTGDLGSGLAYQLLKSGYEVLVGSRSPEKAKQAAADFSSRLPDAKVHAADNAAAAAGADIVIMAVPFTSHQATIESVKQQVQGKIFVDATVPLVPPKVMRAQVPPDGPVARRAQSLLGEDVRVVSAFQNIAAAHLKSEDLGDMACDVLVCGNDAGARSAVIELAGKMGLKAWHAGAIDNSVVAESLTSVLIFLNRKYGLDGAGIRIVSRS